MEDNHLTDIQPALLQEHSRGRSAPVGLGYMPGCPVLQDLQSCKELLWAATIQGDQVGKVGHNNAIGYHLSCHEV